MDSAMEVPVSNHHDELSSSGNTSKLHSCALCGKEFLYYSHLKQHENVHSGDKSFMCEICGKTFVRKSTLNRHMLMHTNKDEIQSSFMCERCGHSFMRKDKFQEHLRILQLSCEECNLKFCTKSDLKEHMRSHPVDKPFSSVKRKMDLPAVNSKKPRQQYKARDLFKTLMFYPNESDEHDIDIFFPVCILN